ncbi:phosphatidylserine/phosphatidylglycerophosphate/cardiolipin synthase family protein [Pararhodobacter sp. CCB-MM2]|uniref:phospholipase D-like domain-containing protein n=1 Tax=Pararhodobacter sp. CCB-MM2 TaxID=1786003 RepID=UPI00082B9E8C|nr:phosphatidylserine/phosphatidylglycerophosphate/cardiolipin synthase family protein [Pararhodobacter sp. CCB-MM2]
MNSWSDWIVGALVLALVLVVVSLWAAGRFAKVRRGNVSHMIPAGDEAEYDRLLEPLEREHVGLSGVRLVPDEAEALALRLSLARKAERSLDLMYYIWEDDLTGRMLAREVLAAADRGVRVRMLIDDVNMIRRVPAYRALDRHPSIEVRLFNPIRNKDMGLLRGAEMIINLLPYNRRMHNKMFIADNRIAITGGRNVGDPYFGAQKGTGICFDDLDIVLAGPVLRSMGSLYDSFWNSDVALPVRTLRLGKQTRLRRFRTYLDRFLGGPSNRERLNRMGLPGPEKAIECLGVDRLDWIDGLEFIADPPEKALQARREGWMPGKIMPVVRSAKKSLRIMTPYLVPGKRGLKTLIELAESGVEIEIITNGLGRSDSVLVYGAYRWYRPRLLKAGIKLVEAARPDQPDTMLHAKTFIVDDERAFVGSFNFDMRSAFLNTELGVLFDDAKLIGQLNDIFDETCAPERGWRVSRDGHVLLWTRGEQSTHLEPGTNWWKRALTFCIGHMPIHGFL